MLGGYDNSPSSGYLNDLWELVGTSWKAITTGSGVTPAKVNYATLSIDTQGNLWLFGGYGVDLHGNYGFFNSLWEYSLSTSTWSLKSGPGVAVTTADTTDAQGVYGTMHVPSLTNIPPAREGAASWIDQDGNFWLFGGQGNLAGWLSDTWEYTSGSGWAWQGGSKVFSSPNSSLCSGSSSPGARVAASAWTDSTGKFWFFGGYGCDSKGNAGVLNDLWSMGSNGSWSMAKGSATVGSAGSYGTLAAPASSNEPPARAGAAAWTDLNGNLWLFGGTTSDIWTFGQGNNYPTAQTLFNDLWEYKPASTGWGAGTWTWIGGASAPAAAPSGRAGAAGWGNGPAAFLVFGGYGVSSGSLNVTCLDDLWISTGVVY